MCSDTTIDSDSERRERVIALFADYLERHDGNVEAASFEQLVADHADLRAELLRARDGLALFRSLRTEIRATHVQSRRRRRRFSLLSAAAVVLIAATWTGVVALRGDRSKKIDPAGELAAAIIDQGEKLLASAAEGHDAIDAAVRGNGFSASTRPDEVAERSERLVDDAATQFHAMYSWVHRAGEAGPRFADGAIDDRLAPVRKSLEIGRPKSWRRRALEDIQSDRASSETVGALLLALKRVPRIHDLAARVSQQPGVDPTLVQAANQILSMAMLRLRVVDLDSGAIDPPGAHVYAQPVDLPSNTIGDAIDLGVTPLPVRPLEPGDWRLTVVDGSGKEERHSQLRVLALPGDTALLRVAFLRRTDRVIAGMAFREGTDIRFGIPPDQKPTIIDLAETRVHVDDLWIDPYEVTCKEYSDFYRDVEDHLEWFDGEDPLHLPRVLEDDGTCSPKMQKRPIVDVTWSEAALYANWAGKRLPTEREWERVARGTFDENRPFPWSGKFDRDRINMSASIAGRILDAAKSGKTFAADTKPVFETLIGAEVDSGEYVGGATPPEDGPPVYRLADNISELVEDLFIFSTPSGAPDPTVWASLPRAIRGGNWMLASMDSSQTWIRSPLATMLGTSFVGFRCAKTNDPGVGQK